MFNAASKLYLTIGVLAVVAGFGTVIATSDRAGFTLLVAGGLASVAIGVASFIFTRKEPLPLPDAPSEVPTVDTTDVARASLFPMIGAVGAAVLGVGAALGAGLVAIGIVIGAVAAFGWLGQAWSEHPRWTAEQSDRLWDRYIAPIGLPATVLVCVILLGIAISRLLLSLSKDFAPVIAIVIAAAILGAGYLLATMENVGRRALAALAVLTGALVIGAGVAGAVKGERPHESEAGKSVEIVIVAKDGRFSTNQLNLPASSSVNLTLRNEDDTAHNLSIYDHRGGTALYTGDTVEPGKQGSKEWSTPAAGTFYFQDDTHTDMNGAVTIVKSENTSASTTGGSSTSGTTSGGTTGGSTSSGSTTTTTAKG